MSGVPAGHSPAVTTLVLVPGAWHGAWAYDALRAELQARCVASSAVDLPTVGDAAADLPDDVAAVRAAVTAVDGPVVLVGHSYGGVVVTEAAHGLEQVQRLVYVTAFAPDAGQSLLDQVDYGPLEWIVPAGDGLLGVADDAVRELFYGDLDPEAAAASQERLQPQAAASFASPVQAAAWHTTPTTYVVCTEDRCIPPQAQRRWAERAGDVVELATSHSPFLARPTALADLLVARL